ncbi:MAG TPA: T9SS type A sorting domain-containing protein [Elusimicrobiota bacterium]|nr:T9SS type A sorting domain-containing protein [Elusimicrobiota bacterium]
MNHRRLILFALVSIASLLMAARPAQANTIQRVQSVTVSAAAGGGFATAITDATGAFGYFGSSVPFLIGTSSFSVVNPVTLNTLTLGSASLGSVGNWDFSAAFLDTNAGYGYFVSSSAPAAIERFSLGAFPVALSSTTLFGGQDWPGSAVVDSGNEFAYIGTTDQQPSVAKVDLTTMLEVSSLTISGAGPLTAAVIDTGGGFAYFGSSTTPGVITKISLSPFQQVAQVTITSGGALTCAVIDTLAGYAYFGTNDSPAHIVKIRLSDFTEQGNLTLNAGENQALSAVIDPTNDRSYFGTGTSPGMVVQIANSGLTVISAIAMNSGENNLASALIDTTNEYAYFGTYTTPGTIVKIDLLYGVATITKQPGSQTVKAGQTATFGVSATGRTLSYQWRINDVPVAGATSSVFSIPNAAFTDDGEHISCLVSNPYGAVSTVEAVLSVQPAPRVYPNPWRADLHGSIPITFDSLAANSTIRLYTVSMHWVKTISASGNAATWDRTNDAGQLVGSGYYFYRINTPDDNQTTTGKLAIIK